MIGGRLRGQGGVLPRGGPRWRGKYMQMITRGGKKKGNLEEGQKKMRTTGTGFSCQGMKRGAKKGKEKGR